MPTLNDLDSIGGSSAKLWVSGESVDQWDYRKSPLDGETYQRKAATGSGTTDPADDVANYLAKSFDRISGLPPGALNATSNFNISQAFKGSTRTTVGAISAGVRTSAINVTGRGIVDFLGVCRGSTGDMRVEILVDGRTLLNEVVTTGSTTEVFTYLGGLAWDAVSSAYNYASPAPGCLYFRRSFQVYLTAISTSAGSLCGLGYILRSQA